MYHGVTQDADDDAPATKKKERVLHTRVPATLERELKRFADNLRTPVSNLVRAVLEDAVEAANHAGEGVEQRLRRAARRIGVERHRLTRHVAPESLSRVFAYQAVTLARAQTCAKCQRALAIGARAHLGLSDDHDAGERVFVCDDCLP